MDTTTEFEKLLKAALKEAGGELTMSAKKIATYMTERATHLSTVVGQPGYEKALIAERNNVAMRAGLQVADDADAFDQRILGLIQGALRIAALALAA